MRKIKKISISSLAAVMMILTPLQAIFADEAVTTNTAPTQEIQSSGNIALQGTEWATIGEPTKLIYMNGEVKVVINAPSWESCDLYSIDQYGSYNYLGELKGGEYLKTKLYGYYKIYAASSVQSGSTYYVIY